VFLTATEIRDLTGRRLCDAQRRALEHMGIPFRVRPDGSLAVLRAHVEAIPGGTISTTQREPELHL
jgi:aminopeptidase-like protein